MCSRQGNAFPFPPNLLHVMDEDTRHRQPQIQAETVAIWWGAPILGALGTAGSPSLPEIMGATTVGRGDSSRAREQSQSCPPLLGHRVTSEGTVKSSCYFLATHLMCHSGKPSQPVNPYKKCFAACCQVGKEKSLSWTAAAGPPVPKKPALATGRCSIGSS